MMEPSAWCEYFFDPDDLLNFSVGTLAGFAMVGFQDPVTGDLAGGPTLLLNPELRAYLNVTDLTRLSVSAGFRLATPFAKMPGLEFWDTCGPTASVDINFRVC